MNEICKELAKELECLPEEVREDLQKRWTEQAIGARIVAEMAAGQN